MRLSLTFTDCTPADVARLLQAAGPLEGASAPALAAAAPAPMMPAAAPAMAPPMQPPAAAPQPPAMQPPAAAPAQQPQQAAAPAGGLTPEHLYEAMSKYSQTYKPDGIKAVMNQVGLTSGLLPQADQTQLYWLKRYFESMKPPGTPFEQL